MVYNTLKWLSHRLQNHCIYCQKKNSGNIFGLCSACEHALSNQQNRCKRCAVLLVGEQVLCGQCLKKAPRFDASSTLCSYHSDISRQCIYGLKHDDTAWLRSCAELLARNNRSASLKIDAIVPIPIHWRKQLLQNNNHSLLLGQRLAKELCLPCKTNLLKSARATKAQKTLTAKARKNNMRGAFYCPTTLEQLRIAVIDDVMTTTATANEAARCLKKAGASHVELWLVARTEKVRFI